MRKILERAGPLALSLRDAVWEILWDGTFLMSSECRTSEHALGALAAGRTLIAGLGMGFTLRAALDVPGVSAVDVVEIAQPVIDWNRGPLAPLAGFPLSDPRVQAICAELLAFLGASPAPYDAVLVDVDNGPSWTVRPENARLYDETGIARLRAAVACGGTLAVWSAQPEPALAARLGRWFARVESRAIDVTVGGRPSEDVIIVATSEQR